MYKTKHIEVTFGVKYYKMKKERNDELRKKDKKVNRAYSFSIWFLIWLVFRCRAFRIMDDDGNRRLDKKEFKKGLHDFGLDIPNDVAEQIFGTIDSDNNGSLDFDEFLNALRVSFNQRSTQHLSVSNVCLDGQLITRRTIIWSCKIFSLSYTATIWSREALLDALNGAVMGILIVFVIVIMTADSNSVSPTETHQRRS